MPSYRITRPQINGKRSEVWYIAWTEEGRSQRVSSGTTDKIEAEQWLEQFKASRATAQDAKPMIAILDGYEQVKLSEGRNASNLRTSLKPLREFFKSFTHNLIRQATIRDYITFRDGRSSSAERELTTLRAALNCAVREGWITSFTQFRIPSSSNPRRRFLSRQEFDRLFAAAETIEMATFLAIAVYTGSRGGKICQLKWSDIDPGAKVIYFAKGEANKKTQPIPINDKLAWVLGVAYLFATNDYVISRNGKPVKSMRKQFNKTVESSGLKDVVIHDLRRTAASWALQGGASISHVAKFLGDSVEVTEKHYGHLATGHIRSITDML